MYVQCQRWERHWRKKRRPWGPLNNMPFGTSGIDSYAAKHGKIFAQLQSFCTLGLSRPRRDRGGLPVGRRRAEGRLQALQSHTQHLPHHIQAVVRGPG